MANVIIQLTVDIEYFMNGDKPDYKKACRLAQFGGEDIGNYLSVNFADSCNSVSFLTVNDVVTWVGVAANFTNSNPDRIYRVDINSIVPTSGESVLGGRLFNKATGLGLTVISHLHATNTDIEQYNIIFSITENGNPIWFPPYTFDPKISVTAP